MMAEESELRSMNLKTCHSLGGLFCILRNQNLYKLRQPLQNQATEWLVLHKINHLFYTLRIIDMKDLLIRIKTLNKAAYFDISEIQNRTK